MAMAMPASIRARLLAGTIAAVAVAFAATTIIVAVLVRGALREQFDEALRAKAGQLAAQIEDRHGRIVNEIDPRTLAPDEAYELWVRGEVFARSADLERELVPAPGTSELTAVGATHQLTLRTTARFGRDDPAGPMPIVLVFARATTEVDAAAHRITLTVAGVGLAGIALCAIVLLLVIQRGLAPLRDLATAIAGIRAQDLTVRLAPGTAARELAPITQRLDELLARLAAAFARERELTAEVAHELRTPLAGLRATIQLALDRERPAERYRGALETCLQIARDTERVVESLLSLARLDAGQTAVDAAPLDLDQLVRDVLDPMHARALERGLAVATELEPVTLTSDRDKLRVIIANLLDNAISYANPGGELRITLAGHVLRVANTGCTLGAGELAHVFDRFWRADTARAHEGHTGIGLALVHKLLELLGGTIAAEVRDGRFIATVTLP